MIADKKNQNLGLSIVLKFYRVKNTPDVLKRLTIVEEAILAHDHPIISTLKLKLRPSDSGTSASYHCDLGHTCGGAEAKRDNTSLSRSPYFLAESTLEY